MLERQANPCMALHPTPHTRRRAFLPGFHTPTPFTHVSKPASHTSWPLQEQQGYYGEDGVWYAWDPASQQYVATQYYDDQQYSYDQAYYEQQYYGQQWYYDEDGNVQYYDG